MKTRARQIDLIIDAGELITQPSQAFTPRQIIEQFARNEVVPTLYEPTDALSDDNVPDDDMDQMIEFEDKIDAEGHLLENQYQLYKEQKDETDKSESPATEGNQKTSNDA